MQSVVDRCYRLSPQQRRLWALHEASSTVPFLAQAHVLIEGPADVRALSAAIRKVIDRYEIFRTRFQVVDQVANGSVCEQVVEATLTAPVYEVHLESDEPPDDVINSVFAAAGWDQIDLD